MQNLVRLNDDLLDVSRITRGNLELRCERVTLAVVLGQALEATGLHVEKGGSRRSREAGFNAHLVKPVDQPSLQGLLTDQPPTGAP